MEKQAQVISREDAFAFLKTNLKNCEFYTHISSKTNKQASAVVYKNGGINEFIPFSSKSLQRLNIVDTGNQKPLINAIKAGKLVLATLDKPAVDKDGKTLPFNARCFCSAGKGEGFEDLEL
jgi:hypothetical protein